MSSSFSLTNMFSNSSKQSQQSQSSPSKNSNFNILQSNNQQNSPKEQQKTYGVKNNPFFNKNSLFNQPKNDIFTNSSNNNIFTNKPKDGKTCLNQFDKDNVFSNQSKERKSLQDINTYSVPSSKDKEGLFPSKQRNQNKFQKETPENIFFKASFKNQLQKIKPQSSSFIGIVQSKSPFGDNPSQMLFNIKNQPLKSNIFTNKQSQSLNTFRDANIASQKILNNKRGSQVQKTIKVDDSQNEVKSKQGKNQISQQKKQNSTSEHENQNLIIQQENKNLKSQNFLKKQTSKSFKNERKLFENESRFLIQDNKTKNQLQLNKDKNVMNVQNENETRTILNVRDEIEKSIKAKKQQIWKTIKKVGERGDKLLLESKLRHLSQFYQKQMEQWFENDRKEKCLLLQNMKIVKQSVKVNKTIIQSLKQQNQEVDHFDSIVHSLKEQSILNSSQINDSQIYPHYIFIDRQMKDLINILKQHFNHSSLSINPETELQNLFKTLQEQSIRQKTLTNNINSSTLKTLTISQSLKLYPNHNKTLKTHNFFYKPIINQQNSVSQQNISAQKNNVAQINQDENEETNLNLLKNLNRKNMVNIFLQSKKIKDTKIENKISEGKTSMIMKSIIME